VSDTYRVENHCGVHGWAQRFQEFDTSAAADAAARILAKRREGRAIRVVRIEHRETIITEIPARSEGGEGT
jgi:hypothetical protein